MAMTKVLIRTKLESFFHFQSLLAEPRTSSDYHLLKDKLNFQNNVISPIMGSTNI